MTIAEVCGATGLTRKAVRYYEEEGLIRPVILGNGYREYSPEIAERLAVIAALRNFSFSIEEIRTALRDERSLRTQFSLKAEELRNSRDVLAARLAIMDEFLSGTRSFEDLASAGAKVEETLRNRPGYLGEKLRGLFPGDFGEVLSAVLGSILDDAVESAEGTAAWAALVAELDALEPVAVPPELAEWSRTRYDRERLSENAGRLKRDYSVPYEEYERNKREALDRFLDGAHDDELAETVKTSRLWAEFFSGAGLPVMLAVSKYLPVLSGHFQRFSRYAARFGGEHPDLMEKLKAAAFGSAHGDDSPAGAP